VALLNLHRGRALEESIGSMDAEALAAVVQQGGLAKPAEDAAVAELARRVLADDIEFDGGPRTRTAPLFNRPPMLAAVLALAVWLAWMLAA
jgi:hypothetical protein